MSAVRLSEPLLSKASLEVLLELLKNYRGPYPLAQLVTDFSSFRHSDRQRLSATLEVLHTIGVLDRTDERGLAYAIGSVWPADRSVATAVMKWANQSDAILGFIDAVQPTAETKRLLLDTQLVPWRMNGLRHFMRELGIFEREAITNRYWSIASEYSDQFLTAARKLNLARPASRVMDRAALDEILARKDQVGDEAEEWVLRRETLRLSNHPLTSQIRRLSQTDVAAGFDIISFSSSATLRHDRFIEVKSYSNAPHFFWTSNEIDAAKALGERYVLVLVDRARMVDGQYSPVEITGPFSYFFETDRDDWDRASAVYEFKRR